jgi:DNA (cytosine-5)-methyltransferase 1
MIIMKKFIDLYSGCGGLSLGLMNSGWTGLFAIERDKFAFDTLKHNLVDGSKGLSHQWPSWLPKEHIDIKRFIKLYRAQLSQLRDTVELIVGGPPCQGFSLVGVREKNDPRNKLFRHYLEIVSLVRPKFLLLENVKGISIEFGKTERGTRKIRKKGRPHKPFSEHIREKLEEIGYTVYPDLVKAVDFGVPQYRPRYLMIGMDRKIVGDLKLPDPFLLLRKIREDFLVSKGLNPKKNVTVKQAISDLETSGKKLMDCVDSKGFKQIGYGSPRTAFQKLMHGTMNGAAPNSLRLARHEVRTVKKFKLIQKTCRHGVQLSIADRKRLGLNKHCLVPLNKDAPSHTLTTLPDDLLHYSEPRILTVREYARLQSFPDWFELRGKYTTGGKLRKKECPRYTQVGNAVPPLLAEAIGHVLMELLRKTEYAQRMSKK